MRISKAVHVVKRGGAWVLGVALVAFVVLYDANVLYPGSLSDLLLRIGAAGIGSSPLEAIDTSRSSLKKFFRCGDRPPYDGQGE